MLLKIVTTVVLTASVSTSALAANSWATCQPAGVMEHPSRVHVRCAQATGTIWYFAIPTTDKERASRFQALATAALLGGRSLSINYDTNDTSGASFGCQANDCRHAYMMEMR